MKKLSLLIAIASTLFSCSTDDSGCTKFAKYETKLINGKTHYYAVCEDGYKVEMNGADSAHHPIGSEYCH